MTRREQMKKAIEEAKNKTKPPAPAKGQKAAPKPHVPGQKPSKRQRSAAARDARKAARGRLPVGTAIATRWDGTLWHGRMETLSGEVISHAAPGLFQLCEELDVMFWEKVATLPPEGGAK